VAGSLVATPTGAVPIETVQPGDFVLTSPEDRPNAAPQVGHVTRIFEDTAALTLWLTFDTGETLGVTPTHEVWTYQDGWTFAGALAEGDALVGSDGTMATIVEIRVDSNSVAVYNLEVEGTHTYYVAGVWVHNNSCPAKLAFAGRVHGAARHNDILHEYAKNFESLYGASTRMNQALVDPLGRKISNLRPDIQYVKNGKVFIVEIEDTSRRVNGRETFRSLLGNSFGGYDTIKVD